MMTNNSCGQNSPAYKEAVRRQAEATSPENSVFVSANAGTGKTHVLTNRVLRLLLSGASPDTILCVTYTKAAAGEMQNRLFKRLGEWAMKAE
ncbi:MAG: UvrD-helicase domain-containing protein, partial [Candidatus Puniceispirillaceae bacterium]